MGIRRETLSMKCKVCQKKCRRFIKPPVWGKGYCSNRCIAFEALDKKEELTEEIIKKFVNECFYPGGFASRTQFVLKETTDEDS